MTVKPFRHTIDTDHIRLLLPRYLFPDVRGSFLPLSPSQRSVFIFYHSSDLPFDPAFLSATEDYYSEVMYIRYTPPETSGPVFPLGSALAYCNKVIIMAGARMLMPDVIARYCRSLGPEED